MRIASLLLNSLPKFARERNTTDLELCLDMTRQQIADLAGTTQETATRVIRALHKNGIVDCSRPGVIKIIDLESLKDLATII